MGEATAGSGGGDRGRTSSRGRQRRGAAIRAARPGGTGPARTAGARAAAVAKAAAPTTALVLLALLLAAPVPAAAQDPAPGGPAEATGGRQADDDGRSRFLLGAGIGLLAPLSDLAPGETGDGATEPEPAPSLSVGVAAAASAVYLVSPKIGVGVHGAWSGPDVDLERVLGDDGGDADRRLGTADYLAASAEVVYRPLGPPGTSALDPYVAAGGGVRRLSFSDPSLADSTDPLGTVAGGVRTALAGPVSWTLEVRGLFSSADPTSRGSRLQSDVLVTVGAGVRP